MTNLKNSRVESLVGIKIVNELLWKLFLYSWKNKNIKKKHKLEYGKYKKKWKREEETIDVDILILNQVQSLIQRLYSCSSSLLLLMFYIVKRIRFLFSTLFFIFHLFLQLDKTAVFFVIYNFFVLSLISNWGEIWKISIVRFTFHSQLNSPLLISSKKRTYKRHKKKEADRNHWNHSMLCTDVYSYLMMNHILNWKTESKVFQCSLFFFCAFIYMFCVS